MDFIVNSAICDMSGMSLPKPFSAEDNENLVNITKSLSELSMNQVPEYRNVSIFPVPTLSMMLGVYRVRYDAKSNPYWRYWNSHDSLSTIFTQPGPLVGDVFTNWAPGEPNLPWDDFHYGDNEFAILRASDGLWEDAREYDSSAVICISFIASG